MRPRTRRGKAARRQAGPALLAGAIVLWIAAGCREAPEPAPPPGSGPEILWDTWGVPHIYADTDTDLAYAFGWAQARSHGDLVLRLYGEARGRGAEYWGPEYLAQDRLLRTLGVPRRAAAWLTRQDPEMRAYLEAFAAGINAFVAAHPERIDDEVEAVLPVTAADVLAHAHRLLQLEFVGREVRGRAAAWASQDGSNGWAIAPSRSASGHALLLVNPHLPWSGFFTWFEAHLVTPPMDMTGAALVGTPTLELGFNARLGWTHTNNPLDGVDLYELTLADGGYLFDGEVRAFEVAAETLKVKGADGTMAEQLLTVRRSVHGPVLEQTAGRALAVRLAGLDRPHAVRQWWAMDRARNLDEFLAALRQHQMPMWNVIYADVDGHILYRYNGLIPKRGFGDEGFWAGVVPGDTSATLWTQVHAFEDLPMVVDPPGGWVQNANDPPWSATDPPAFDPADFPSYFPARRLAFRPQRSLKMLRADESISFEELVRYKHSTRVEAAERLADDLIGAARRYGDREARAAAEVLAGWDRTADAGSVGGVVFALWYLRMRDRTGAPLTARPWDPAAPLSTPDGLRDPEDAARALGAVAAKMKADFGTLAVPWGAGLRLRRGAVDLPASGGPGRLGIFRVLDGMPDPDGRYRVVAGDSFVAVVEFSRPPRARVLLGYGNASQPGSPHVGDQLELMSRQELRPAWRTRAEVEAHLELREVLAGGREGD